MVIAFQSFQEHFEKSTTIMMMTCLFSSFQNVMKKVKAGYFNYEIAGLDK